MTSPPPLPSPGSVKSDFLRIMLERGYVHQCTDLAGLDDTLHAGRVTAYVGYDGTADSLHVGSLVSIMMLRWFQHTGHRPIVLIGGGTTKVGDPSGKDDARQLLGDDQIDANMAGIRRSFDAYLTFGDGSAGDDRAIMANNADWLDGLRYIPLLRDIGRHFSVNRMLTQDSVRMRLEREQPLSFLEFNYMILQSYDYLELGRRHGCALQMGGSDQWGNIIMGADLCRRIDQRPAFGLTTPLITTASGAKMGKTASGAVWLNEDRLPVFDFWQYWRNTEDADVGRFLRLYTDLPLDEIARLDALGGAEINEAKKILATEATALRHGRDKAMSAARTAEQTFEHGGLGSDLPTLAVPCRELDTGIALFVLMTRAGLTASNGEARRLIKGGGGRINGKVVGDETRTVTPADLTEDGVIKISAGRKKHALVRPDTA